jgi:hypothetical protein
MYRRRCSWLLLLAADAHGAGAMDAPALLPADMVVIGREQ